MSAALRGSSAGRARRRRQQAAALVALAALLLPSWAAAAVSCSVTATGPAFGVYNPLSASPALSNGQVSASCTLTGGGATTVSLVSSYSAGSSNSFANRTMLSGASTLNYNLYYDAAFTQVRGNGTGGSQTGGATLNLSNGNPTQSVTAVIYGRIPAGQDVTPGSYADIIVVTITY
jgi:spore coat protein U-like protein